LAAGFGAGVLRCEYGTDPAAVETVRPRLSWVVETAAKDRGVRQSAYQILVASRWDVLDGGAGDLWDSGKVRSDQSVNVVYGGKPLESAQAAWWKVRLWDGEGRVSAWSQPGRWTMGLLKPADWRARWIGLDPGEEDGDGIAARMEPLLELKGSSWVWAHGAVAGSQPVGKVYFRKVVEMPSDRKVVQARIRLTADDGFQLYVNGEVAGQGSSWQVVSTVDVTSRLQAGANGVGLEVANAGEHPSPAGVVGRLVVLFDAGEPMVIPVDATWQTTREAGGRWSSPDERTGEWKPAAVVAKYGDAPWGEVRASTYRMLPAPFFRRTFTVSKPVQHATVYASALGVYELRLNGRPVEQDVLSPGWTDYRKRVHYFGYDVSRQLRKGPNALGAILGDGWYAGYLAFTGKRQYYGDRTRFLAQLHIEYQDGTTEVVGTDGQWKAAFGPIRENDMLMGCLYDARMEMPGWDTPDFDERGWRPAVVDAGVRVNLEAHPGAPIRRIEEVPACKLTEPKPGVYVFDLGQNLVGWARLRARGEAGQKVVVRHAEMLNPDGTIYTVNLRAAKATDTFLLAGGGQRGYEPYFTFHGFQYVEVTGLDYRPDLKDVVGVVVHSDLPRAGWFECSEPLVNKLTLNSLWGQKGNFLDVPTDCPQRDERAGWTGDAQVFMKTACLNMDAPGFYTKWLIDLCEDSQRADGGFGDVAPHISIVSHGNTGWSDAGPVCNWQMYQMYGDTGPMQRHYAALTRHSEYLAKTSQEHVRGTGAYGDWLRLEGPQHSDAIGTAYYYHTTRLMERTAVALGKGDDAARYRELAGRIADTFARRFVKDDGRILDGKGQTGQSLYALAFGLDLVPEDRRAAAARQFRAAIQQQNDHLATGFLGTPFVLEALQKAGYPELAYKLVLNKTYPSWLQQVLWGSTTMWERWDGWRPDKGFQDPGMNSFNHYWLGCVSEWLFTQAAGMDTDGPGFQRIRFRPVILADGGGLEWVRATYASLRGRITSGWSLKDGSLEMRVLVPGNCTATVHVPAAGADDVTEGGRPAARSQGVRYLGQEKDAAVFEVGSGEYVFRCASPSSARAATAGRHGVPGL